MRMSNDERDAAGQLVNGFDYGLQAWVINGKVQRCGHPDGMKCDCNGRRFAGMSLRDANSLRTRDQG